MGGDYTSPPEKRAAAHVDYKASKIDRIRSRPILIERAVHIEDLKHLKFEGRSLYEVLITERGWTRILEIKGEVYSDIVYDFYKSLRSRQLGLTNNKLSASVRGVEVVITPETIASFLRLRHRHKNQKSSQQPIGRELIHRALTGSTEQNVEKAISEKDLLPFFQMLHLIVAANVTPTKFKKINIDVRGRFLLNIARGVDIDLPCHIIESIKNAANDAESSKKGLPFGLLITALSLEAGVKPRDREREVQPPVDPICLIHKPIHESGPHSCPSTPQAAPDTASSSQTLPPFDVMLLQIGSRVAAEVAPIQNQLEGMESRLKTLEDGVKELYGILDERDKDQPSSYIIL